MKNQPDQKLNKLPAVRMTERQSPAALTLILALLILFIYHSYQSAHSQSWIMSNTFQVEQILNLVNTQKYGQIGSLLFLSNLANVNVWQLFISVYFVCLLGIPVEKRLGPSRFINLILLSCTLPWVIQFLDLSYCPVWPLPFEHPKQDVYFFGPYCIILALAGAYNWLMPKKVADRTQSRLYRKDRTEVFNRAQNKPMNERFGFSPHLFFIAALVYVFVAHYVTTYFYQNYDTIGLYAGLVALGSGYFVPALISKGLDDSYQEHPLKLAAIKYYYELVDLDVGHDNAVKGAAQSLGLPEEQIQDWVKKTKGKLRPV